MKYKFEEGDGLCMSQTSREDRRKMHFLLEEFGYKMNVPTEKRVETDWIRSLEFFKGMWICSDQIIPGNSYTYDQMYSKIRTKSPLIVVGLKVVRKSLIVWIVEQEDRIPRGEGELYMAENGIYFYSAEVSDADKGTIFVLGESEDDEDVSVISFDSEQEAINAENRFRDAIREFNLNYKNLPIPLPVLELYGANREIKFATVDRDGEPYGYEEKPSTEPSGVYWASSEGETIHLEALSGEQLSPLRKMDWNKSLHVVKHVKIFKPKRFEVI